MIRRYDTNGKLVEMELLALVTEEGGRAEVLEIGVHGERQARPVASARHPKPGTARASLRQGYTLIHDIMRTLLDLRVEQALRRR